MLKIKVPLIQHEPTKDERLIIAGDIQIDTVGRDVIINGQHIPVTVKEYKLLLLFASKPNTVIGKNDILTSAWDGAVVSENHDILYTHIKNLRKKLDAAGGKTSLRSIYGQGYKLRIEK